jgi:hypothetical protein
LLGYGGYAGRPPLVPYNSGHFPVPFQQQQYGQFSSPMLQQHQQPMQFVGAQVQQQHQQGFVAQPTQQQHHQVPPGAGVQRQKKKKKKAAAPQVQVQPQQPVLSAPPLNQAAAPVPPQIQFQAQSSFQPSYDMHSSQVQSQVQAHVPFLPQPAVTPPTEHSTVADVVKTKKPVWCWKCANDTHISKECKVQHYCYICDKLAHPTVRCPVLKNPRPTAFVAGVGTYETFFTTLPDSVVKDDLAPNASPVARVVVSGDMVPSDVIQKQMARRCPSKAKWKWEAIPNGDNEFLISFPSFHDLDVVDGIQVAVPGFNSQMSVTAWKPTDIPHKFELEQVWLHVEGVPHNVRHFWGLWAVGSLMGKTLDVDLISLRRRGVVRVLVGMFDTTKFAKKLDKDGACVKSDVVLKLKGYEFRFRREPTDYIPESDFVPFVWKKKDGDGDSDEGKGKEQEDLMDTSEFGQGTVSVQTMNQT